MEQLLVMAFAEMVRRQARQMPKPGWVLDKERAQRQSHDNMRNQQSTNSRGSSGPGTQRAA
jgi:hypothetical protein